jgi:hypothetical protein
MKFTSLMKYRNSLEIDQAKSWAKKSHPKVACSAAKAQSAITVFALA